MLFHFSQTFIWSSTRLEATGYWQNLQQYHQLKSKIVTDRNSSRWNKNECRSNLMPIPGDISFCNSGIQGELPRKWLKYNISQNWTNKPRTILFLLLVCNKFKQFFCKHTPKIWKDDREAFTMVCAELNGFCFDLK